MRDPALTSFNAQYSTSMPRISLSKCDRFHRAISHGNSVQWYWTDVRLATAKRIDGNRGESASDGDLVEEALTLSSCEREGYDHQTP